MTFLSVPGHILALIDNGELKILSAQGANTKLVTSYRVAEARTWAPPVLLNDGFLIKDRETLTRWTFSSK